MDGDRRAGDAPVNAREDGPARPGWRGWVGAALVVAVASALAFSKRRELVQALQLIAEVRLPQLAVAVMCEAASIVCLAAVPRRLLRAGGVSWGLPGMTAVVLGANAMAGVLPGGAALATAWVFRQLRRRGVDAILAAAVLVVAGALSAIGLGVLMTFGLFTVGSAGAAAVIRPVAGVLTLAAVTALAVLVLFRFTYVRRRAKAAWADAGRRSRRIRRLERSLAALVAQARTLEPGLLPWLPPAAFALLNWVFDLACLAACAWALRVGLPWEGLLLAYTLTQIPGSLRLTPGSLGVVETSLSALLVLYGLASGPAIAVVLLYRAVSYWALQPVGWAAWITVASRRTA